jgi:hypothetical protein
VYAAMITLLAHAASTVASTAYANRPPMQAPAGWVLASASNICWKGHKARLDNQDSMRCQHSHAISALWTKLTLSTRPMYGGSVSPAAAQIST